MSAFVTLSTRAATFEELDREKHTVSFNINDQQSVDTYLAQPGVKNVLLGGYKQLDTCRLWQQVDTEKKTLTFGRSVTRNTVPEIANYTLAQTVLTFVLDANDVGARADVWIGLTGTPLTDFTPDTQHSMAQT